MQAEALQSGGLRSENRRAISQSIDGKVDRLLEIVSVFSLVRSANFEQLSSMELQPQAHLYRNQSKDENNYSTRCGIVSRVQGFGHCTISRQNNLAVTPLK